MQQKIKILLSNVDFKKFVRFWRIFWWTFFRVVFSKHFLNEFFSIARRPTKFATEKRTLISNILSVNVVESNRKYFGCLLDKKFFVQFFDWKFTVTTLSPGIRCSGDCLNISGNRIIFTSACVTAFYQSIVSWDYFVWIRPHKFPLSYIICYPLFFSLKGF